MQNEERIVDWPASRHYGAAKHHSCTLGFLVSTLIYDYSWSMEIKSSPNVCIVMINLN